MYKVSDHGSGTMGGPSPSPGDFRRINFVLRISVPYADYVCEQKQQTKIK